jgi:hypothetical protein
MRSGALCPALEERIFVIRESHMHTVEAGVGNPKVLPLVGSAALLARKRGCRDVAGERERVVQQLAQAGLGAVQAGAAP